MAGKSSGERSRHPYNQEDEKGVIRWVNQALDAGGYPDIVTDLTADMRDGITLIKLVHSLSAEKIPRYSPVPMMRAKKLENLQICLTFLQEQLHVAVNGVQAEDVLAGDLESILLICNGLKTHFAHLPSSANTRNTKVQRSLAYSTVEKEDMRVFTWLGQQTGKEITSYSVLHDGHLLCELINKVHEGAISEKELSRCQDSVSRLKLAECAGRKHLFMSSSFDPTQVSSGNQDSQLRSFLEQCKQVYQRRAHRIGAGLARSSSNKERVSVSSGGREAREAAHVTARSYEALHSKKTEGALDPSLTAAPKTRYPDLYVQGASSYTDLSSRRAEHESMLHGATRSIGRQSSGSSESLDLYAPFMGSLDRVQSMETGISQGQSKPWRAQSNEQSVTLPRSASQGNLPPAVYPSHPPPRPPLSKSLARSTESFHTQTFGLTSGRRTPSYVHLSSANEEKSEQLTALEERVGVLASQFLYERQDMFKQILRALVKERRRRQLAEQRIECLEKNSRQLVQHYDLRFIEIAKQVATLRSEVGCQKGGSTTNMVATEIEQLKEQLSNLKDVRSPLHLQDSPRSSTAAASADHTLFLRKRKDSELTAKEGSRQPLAMENNTLAAYSKGSAASYKKLSRFFGEEPPRVENLESLLDELGYMDYLPTLRAHNISLVELRTLSEEHLGMIGIPLGVRVRLLEESKKLEPINTVTLVS